MRNQGVNTVKSWKPTKCVSCTKGAGTYEYKYLTHEHTLVNRVRKSIQEGFNIIVKFRWFLNPKPDSIRDVRVAVNKKNFIPTTVYMFGIEALRKPLEHKPERRQYYVL